MIYTSHFSRTKSVPNPISIAIGTPKWFTGDVYLKLAPTWDMVRDYKEDGDKRKYTEKYIQLLRDRGVTIELLKKELPDECTLLCWEAPKDFCHRHIVAWILNNAGIPAKEWEPDEQQTTKTK